MPLDYDGRVFRSVANDEGGDVGDKTVFHYHQEGTLVWATYSGGQVRFGTLIAQADVRGNLDARYQHMTSEGELRSGRCRSTPELLEDGRLRVHEEWTWTHGARGEGRSVIEEVGVAAP